MSADADDDRARDLWTRVTTNDGWRALLRKAAEYGSVASGVRRLVEWINNQHDYEAERQLSSASFQAMFSEAISGDEPWESGVRSLADLQKASVILGMVQTPQHAAALQQVVTRSVEDLLEQETDAQRLDDETSALKELVTIIPLRIVPLVRRMETHTDERHAEESAKSSTTTDSQTYADSTDAGGDIDLDGMFSSLLER